jgi:hypothetical protein
MADTGLETLPQYELLCDDARLHLPNDVQVLESGPLCENPL